MDMKKLITNFRQFTLERRTVKLTKIKMSSYRVKYQKGAQPQLLNVLVQIVQGSVILFYDSNNEPFYFLRDDKIISFDDTIPLEVTLFVEGAENVYLQFIDEHRKMDFVAALSAFSQLSNNSSSGSSNGDSGQSTLS